MFKRLVFHLSIIVVIMVSVVPQKPVTAEIIPQFFAAPSMVMPGGSVTFSGFDFPPSQDLDFYLQTSPSSYLGMLTTDLTGQLSGSLSIPSVSPGDYLVMVSPFDIETGLTILPEITIDLFPTNGAPGTIVHFFANNLQPGQLRLDYDGLPIYGPVDIPGGIFEGDFIVPSDRPAGFPGDVSVTAVNRIGNQVIGSASTFFLAEPPIPSNYSVVNVEFPPNPVVPGYLFTVTGTISPAPQGPINTYDLKLLWKSGSGQVVPITVGIPILDPGGAFSITGRAPSLKAGDPLVPDTLQGGQVGVAFFDKGANTNSVILPIGYGIEPSPPVLKVLVQDTEGNPIPNAIVDVRAFQSIADKTITGTTSSGTQVLSNDLGYLQIHPNQISNYLGASDPAESDPFTCKQTNNYGRTDEFGIFEVKFDPEQLAMMGEKIPLIVTDQSKYMETATEIIFPLSVNAIHQGYGPGGKAELFVKQMRFSSNTNLFTDPVTKHTIATNPLVVTLGQLLPGEKVAIPIVPKVKKINSSQAAGAVLQHYENYLGQGYPATAYGKFYSFPQTKFPDAWFFGNGGIVVEFQHDPQLYGTLNEDKLKLTLDGTEYSFVYVGNKYPGEVDCDAIVYRATIPNFHRFSAGTHTGMISIEDMGNPVNITKYGLFFNFVEAPLWILNGKYQYRRIYLNSSNIKMEASQYLPGSPNSSTNLDTNVPSVGWLNNRNAMEDLVSQTLFPDKTSLIDYDSESNAMALNNASDPKDFEGSNAGGSEIAIPQTKIKIIETPKMPLYRNVFGIPPIAGATIGADMWFDAWLTTEGTIKFMGSGATSTTVIVTPEANVYVDAFFDLSVLFGLVSASAHAVPNIGLKMPTTFVDGALLDSNKCFKYSLKIQWKAKVGECPLCKKKSGTKWIFDDSNPSPCPVSGTSSTLSANAIITAETPDPPSYSPSAAVDGFGHTLIVWSDDNNNIQSKALSGGQLSSEIAVTSGFSSIDPEVVFYAPNKAIAVWTESNLTSGETDAATLDAIVNSQFLQYALWDGAAWSAPQNLTAPADSLGDGSVVLAGCMSTVAGCTTAGKVTAVWVRNLNADLYNHQFRLFSAEFTTGVWGTAAAVDPSSTAMDADASAVYRPDGTAQVVWVRDADRDVGTLDDRQIAQRQLSSGASVIVESGLPTGAAEPSLQVNSSGEMVLAYTVATDSDAFIGNQRQLYSSNQTCSGGCSWNTQALTDSNGRPIHAESPTLTLNSNGKAMITYRALGFGPAVPGGPTILPGDPLGTVLGTGSLGQAYLSFSSPVIAPSYTAQTGGTIWQTTSVYDPLLNQTYAVSSQGSSPALPAQAINVLETMGIATQDLIAVEDAVGFSVSSDEADFSVSSVVPSTLYPQPGMDPLSVVITILNNGPSFTSGGELGDLFLKLAWDAPVGTGLPAGEVVIPWIDAGSVTLAEFISDPDFGNMALPPAPHLPHKLYVEVNPGQYIPESDFQNNQVVIDIGGLPTPQGLTGFAQPGDSSVFLEWQPVEHISVAGYRIYRSSDGRTFEPVGSSFIPAFVDLSGALGHQFVYRITAYSEDGFESDLSNPLTAQIDPLYPVFLPVIVR